MKKKQQQLVSPALVVAAAAAAAAAVWLCLSSSTAVWGFNLEPRLAIVKKGTPGSYFGFSVSQHQIVTKDRIESVLLVGAPLEKNGAAEWTPGAIWKCPFTARSDDCSPLRELTAKKKKILQKDDHGQWLGSVVYSQGPGKPSLKFAIYIHLYTYRVYLDSV